MNIIQKIIKKALYYPMPIQLRLYLLRKTGASIGKGSVILSGCNINVSQLIIGDNTWIGKNCYIWASTTESSLVHIGNNVMIAHLVNICCVTHQVGTNQKRAGKTINKSITIEDGCWIGTNATILPGVTIGHGSIVAAGALVNSNIEANSLYAGVPARKIKDLA